MNTWSEIKTAVYTRVGNCIAHEQDRRAGTHFYPQSGGIAVRGKTPMAGGFLMDTVYAEDLPMDADAVVDACVRSNVAIAERESREPTEDEQFFADVIEPALIVGGWFGK